MLSRLALTPLTTLLSLAAALGLAAGVVALVGVAPGAALAVLLDGAFGYGEGLGFTLYYTTDYLLAGLAVAVAYRAGLFNIGAEGQALMGGLGAALVALSLDGAPWPVVSAAGALAAMAFGAVWAAIPGWLQARRGSHIVITTIMFNFIASAFLTWLLVAVMIRPGQAAPESRSFEAASGLPGLGPLLAPLGLDLGSAPLTVAFPAALGLALLLGLVLQRSRWGYGVRAVGLNAEAARYAGISPAGVTIGVMALSGACAGLIGAHEILGVHHRLLPDFAAGAGFVGIAVALMGRGRALGIVLSALLLGALQQGGSELALTYRQLDRDLVVVIQGLIILCTGALEPLFRALALRLLGLARVPVAAG